ncbi:hypothetical protein BIT28_00930 [Photobacterium proteolyticum]|uniref:DGQHR domain-containing protein n=1 Tax=Photobacterium proteolyticum TaxID=1903952 RepID=A0A1Q9GX72_9GAMM|nr:DGQHR domain-containing protein [Photobacterium proteolyticum]OLQ79847.1 hypothetical protein BIT28_00930 [Photobacterium proteolyticum]
MSKVKNFFETNVLEVHQPFSTFYTFKIKASMLVELVFSMSAYSQNGKLNGVQRKLRDDRINQIALYSRSNRTTYPNTVILSANFKSDGSFVDDENIRWGIKNEKLIIPTNKKIASIIDGQHRIEGIKKAISDGAFRDYDMICSVYIDLHFAEQAEIFTSINFNQKKVDKSIAYELFGYNVDETNSDYWSPDTLAIFLTRILNSESETSFKGKIYTSFEGSKKPSGWNISTACFVEAISSLITSDATRDRYKIHESGLFLSKGRKRLIDKKYKQVLREFYIDGRDRDIYSIILAYLSKLDTLGWFSNDEFVTTRAIGILAIFDVLRIVLSNIDSNDYLFLDFKMMDKVDVNALKKSNFNFSGIGRAEVRNLILRYIS